MNLTDGRPIVFFDLETTGTNLQTDRIVEFTVVKIQPDGTREVKTRRLNPEMHIPREASEVHHITDEDVKDAPKFRQISKNLYIYLEGCDLGGYNILKFDIPMLEREFSRAGLPFTTRGRRIVDVYNIFCRMEPRNLSAAYRFFCGKKIEDAHSAEADTLATVEVYEAQLARYADWQPGDFPESVEAFPKTLDEMSEFCQVKPAGGVDRTGRFRWREDEVIVAFGRWSGTPLKKIAVENPDFLRWLLKADFPDDVKKIASDALVGIFPVKGS
ncbi:MAG: 3'-5' exonuclease [Lentisphaeria bacterium]|nr:3'-5' exonuclease [Lentisphaeria bacterium]